MRNNKAALLLTSALAIGLLTGCGAKSSFYPEIDQNGSVFKGFVLKESPFKVCEEADSYPVKMDGKKYCFEPDHTRRDFKPVTDKSILNDYECESGETLSYMPLDPVDKKYLFCFDLNPDHGHGHKGSDKKGSDKKKDPKKK
jgi:hypothetical protein